jgi:hypothetical protein
MLGGDRMPGGILSFGNEDCKGHAAMIELFEAAFSNVNLAYTILLIVMLAYWGIVLLGVVDLDPFGFDLDGGAGTDAGADVGGDVGSGDVGGSDGFSWLNFFNVGEVPIMIYGSILIITMWIVSLQVNHWLDSYSPVAAHRGWIAAALALPNLLFAAFLAKLLLTPVRRMRHQRPQYTRLEGKTCLVTSLEVNETFGRCELPKVDGSLILNVRTRGGEVLQKGDAVEILERVEDGDAEYYVVTRKAWEQ